MERKFPNCYPISYKSKRDYTILVEKHGWVKTPECDLNSFAFNQLEERSCYASPEKIANDAVKTFYNRQFEKKMVTTFKQWGLLVTHVIPLANGGTCLNRKWLRNRELPMIVPASVDQKIYKRLPVNETDFLRADPANGRIVNSRLWLNASLRMK